MNTIISRWELQVLAILAILFTIKFCQPLLFPIFFAFNLYFLIYPVFAWLLRLKVPQIFASTLIVLGLLGLISLGITFLVQPASHWVEKAPEHFKIIEHKIGFVKKSLGKLNKVAETAQNMTADPKENEVKIATPDTSLGSSLFDLTSNILIMIFTILILLFFLLIYFKPFIQTLEKVIYSRRKTTRENAFLRSLKNEVSSYMFTFTLICAGLGAIMTLAFWLLDLPNPILWGTMVMMLTFIPYLGHLIGIITIFFVSLITFNSYFQIFAPPVTYFLFTVLEGQFITPILLGSRLNLNPLIIFLNIFLWSWLWGITGIIISVPLLVTIKIILEHLSTDVKYGSLLESL
ncbi:MAG: AI-2E family transporter [Tatlockia sp.]|nr:AI-2E family transporter [Tatlockia sp.]